MKPSSNDIVSIMLQNLSSLHNVNLFRNIIENPINNKNFPLIEKYIHKNDKNELEKIHLKIFMAGYNNENIEISFRDVDRTLKIVGSIKEENEHFPKNNENIIKVTNNVSAKSFSLAFNINGFKHENFEMKDGVLSFDLVPTENSRFTKIDF